MCTGEAERITGTPREGKSIIFFGDQSSDGVNKPSLGGTPKLATLAGEALRALVLIDAQGTRTTLSWPVGSFFQPIITSEMLRMGSLRKDLEVKLWIS